MAMARPATSGIGYRAIVRRAGELESFVPRREALEEDSTEQFALPERIGRLGREISALFHGTTEATVRDGPEADEPANPTERALNIILAEMRQHVPYDSASVQEPLMLDERLVGMLAIDKREAGFFTSEHQTVATMFASLAAEAMTCRDTSRAADQRD